MKSLLQHANSFELDLPLPPTDNRLYATVRNRRVLTAKGKNWKEYVVVASQNAMQLDGIDKPEPGTPWCVVFKIWCNRRRDITNMTKATIDAIAIAIGVDDAYLDSCSIARVGSREQKMIVEVYW